MSRPVFYYHKLASLVLLIINTMLCRLHKCRIYNSKVYLIDSPIDQNRHLLYTLDSKLTQNSVTKIEYLIYIYLERLL